MSVTINSDVTEATVTPANNTGMEFAGAVSVASGDLVPVATDKYVAIKSGTASPEGAIEKTVLATHTVRAAKAANSAESLLESMFGAAGAAMRGKLAKLYPVFAFNRQGVPTGYYLAPTFNSARAQACKACREGFASAIVLCPMETGKYTMRSLQSGDWSDLAVYTAMPKVNGKRMVRFI
jgi:hypothetical protein